MCIAVPVGGGVKSIKALGEGISEVLIDASTDPHAAGEILGVPCDDFIS